MAREIDLSRPLSEDDIAYLKERHPLAMVEHYVSIAGQAEADPEDDIDDDLDVSEMDEDALRAVSVELGRAVDMVLARADELGIELEEFPSTDAQEDETPVSNPGAGGTGDPAPEPAPSGEMKEGDDPSGFKVPQVQAYLLTASDEESKRVLAAEKAGQGRKSILEG